MSYKWKFYLIFLLCELSAERKMVYKKDMSEYCRRRVIPSVFLGRKVMEANSQIMHFSRLELPYSCFVSVRTESGSSIIIVIEVPSDLEQACNANSEQLLVYEIGDTFGGYWGALPDQVIYQKPQESANYYTLTNTPKTGITIDDSPDDETEPTKSMRNTSPVASGEDSGASNDAEGDFLTLELPIVNVSAKLVPGEVPYNPMFNLEDAFNLGIDVTPRKGEQYETTMLPLVQFSIDTIVTGKRRGGGVEYSPYFAGSIDYQDLFTPDPRLTFQLLDFLTTTKHTKTRRYKYNANRLLHLKKDKHFVAAKELAAHKKQQTTQYSIEPYNIFTRMYEFIRPSKFTKKEVNSDSWEIINDIIKNLNKTTEVTTQSSHKSDFLHQISEVEHKISAYLDRNVSMNSILASSTSQLTTKRYAIDSVTWKLPSITYSTEPFEELHATQSSEVEDLIKSSKTLDNIGVIGKSANETKQSVNVRNDTILVLSNRMTTTQTQTQIPQTTPKSSNLLTGSLVGHESWENVVQSAPVMAVMLNKTIVQDDGIAVYDHPIFKATDAGHNNRSRGKRYIYGIPIENAKPHELTTVKSHRTTAMATLKIANEQELAELIEVQDDEMQDRLALRYLRQYVGPALYNICEHSDTARQIHLFNSSRIVLAINNFTMYSMTVVLTPARSVSGESRCGSETLECQVGGSRVCIDSLCTCDGIPNCGSYEVYDEDRLMCGASTGQHNVCLAAFTFLAMLLTVLYIVHYWLKRCVPRVSDAFFVYSEAAENILYLDTIMRAPDDSEDGMSQYGTRTFQEEVQNLGLDQGKSTRNFFREFCKRLMSLCRCKRQKRVLSHEDMLGDIYRMLPERFNALAMEMRKPCVDAAVQTASSLDMQVRKKERFLQLTHKRNSNAGHSNETSSSNDFKMSPESGSQKTFDELSLLKFFRNARTVSMHSDELEGNKVFSPSQNISQITEEELGCVDLERATVLPVGPVPTTSDIQFYKPEHVQKHLRFVEEATTIPPDLETDPESGVEDENSWQHNFDAKKSYRSQPLHTIDEAHGSRDYKSYFWSGGKSKANKEKKKTEKKNTKKKKTRLSQR